MNPLEFMPLNETRTLVGVVVSPANETKQIASSLQVRVVTLTTKFTLYTRLPATQ